MCFFRNFALTEAQSVFIVDEHLHSGGVVKLVITSACHAEGRGFESRLSRHFKFKIIKATLAVAFLF